MTYVLSLDFQIIFKKFLSFKIAEIFFQKTTPDITFCEFGLLMKLPEYSTTHDNYQVLQTLVIFQEKHESF